jgi:hypothetical protein
MAGRDRVDIHQRQDITIFQNLKTGDFTPNDLTKNTIVIEMRFGHSLPSFPIDCSSTLVLTPATVKRLSIQP